MQARLTRLFLITALTLLATPAFAGNGKGALKMVPDDALAVVHIDFARIQQSDLFKQMWEMVAAKPKTKKQLDDLKAKFGVDVMKDIKGFTMYFPADFQKSENMAVVLEGHFDKVAILAGVKKEDKTLTKRSHAGAEYHVGKKEDGALAFVGGHLVVGKVDAVKRVLTARSGKNVTHAKELGKQLKSVKQGGDFWFATRFDANIKKNFPKKASKQLGLTDDEIQNLSGVSGSIDLAKGLGVALRLGTGDSSAAKKIADVMAKGIAEVGKNPQLAAMGLRDLNKKSTVKAAGKNVSMAINLDQGAMKKLQMMAGIIMMGAMNQGGKK